jgi:hypothetical protein
MRRDDPPAMVRDPYCPIYVGITLAVRRYHSVWRAKIFSPLQKVWLFPASIFEDNLVDPGDYRSSAKLIPSAYGSRVSFFSCGLLIDVGEKPV